VSVASGQRRLFGEHVGAEVVQAVAVVALGQWGAVHAADQAASAGVEHASFVDLFERVGDVQQADLLVGVEHVEHGVVYQ